MLLAADIGGTKGLIGLFRTGSDRPVRTVVREYATADFDTLDQMVEAMAWAIEHPPEAVRIIEVEGIRRISLQGQANSEALCHL